MKYLFALLALTLGGCSTMEGLGNDLESGWQTVSGSVAKLVDPIVEAKKKLPVYDGTCPAIAVRPDLANIVDFYNPSNPDPATKVSEAKIIGVKNTCRVENDAMVMQIDLSLTGATGQKARVKPTDKPSFAYPYFIAVTDGTGTVLAKEIFAASLIYGSNQNESSQIETIFQNMPFPDASIGQVYNVVVGFQLTPDQLAYNNKLGATP